MLGVALVLQDKFALTELMPIPCAAALAQLGAGRRARDAAQGALAAFNGFKFLLALPSQAVTFLVSGG